MRIHRKVISLVDLILEVIWLVDWGLEVISLVDLILEVIWLVDWGLEVISLVDLILEVIWLVDWGLDVIALVDSDGIASVSKAAVQSNPPIAWIGSQVSSDSLILFYLWWKIDLIGYLSLEVVLLGSHGIAISYWFSSFKQCSYWSTQVIVFGLMYNTWSYRLHIERI